MSLVNRAHESTGRFGKDRGLGQGFHAQLKLRLRLVAARHPGSILRSLPSNLSTQSRTTVNISIHYVMKQSSSLMKDSFDTTKIFDDEKSILTLQLYKHKNKSFQVRINQFSILCYHTRLLQRNAYSNADRFWRVFVDTEDDNIEIYSKMINKKHVLDL